MKRVVALLLVGMLGSAGAVPTATIGSVTKDDKNVIKVSYSVSASTIVTWSVQTNGVAVDAQKLRRVWGDVNRKVSGTDCAFYWAMGEDLPGTEVPVESLTVILTTWALDAPPNYMVVDLKGANGVMFFESAETIPGGVSNRLYKTERMVMRKIPAKGVVWHMSSQAGEEGRNGALEIYHEVELTSDYYLGIYPVTMMQSEVVGKAAKNCLFYGCKDWEMKPYNNFSYLIARGESDLAKWGKSNPSHHVDTASAYYLQAFRGRTGLEIDFPTEAQWEFACRAGRKGMFYSGTSDMDDIGWNKDNWSNDPVCSSNELHVVGLLKPNAFGLYDMHGNVREWCLDWCSTDSTFSDGSKATDPAGPDQADSLNSQRVLRGGCYDKAATNCRSAARGFLLWGSNEGNVGWRACCPAVIR